MGQRMFHFYGQGIRTYRWNLFFFEFFFKKKNVWKVVSGPATGVPTIHPDLSIKTTRNVTSWTLLFLSMYPAKIGL